MPALSRSGDCCAWHRTDGPLDSACGPGVRLPASTPDILEAARGALEAVLFDVMCDAIAAEREACAKLAETAYPRGGAHSHASRERYFALEDASEAIAQRIRARR